MPRANIVNRIADTPQDHLSRSTAESKTLVLVALLLIPSLSYAATSRNTYKWTRQAPMQDARSGSCSAMLPDGRILVTGGSAGADALASVEMLSANQVISSVSPMATPRANHICAVLPGGDVMVAGGTTLGGGITNAAEVYDAAKGQWASTEAMAVPRAGATATLLNDGRVLIAGGNTAGGASNTLEIFDPASRSFRAFPFTLSSPRLGHAAAALQDGRVLIAGGSNGSAVLNSVDVFDPSISTIAAGVPMRTARVGLSATTLLTGNVLFAGGNDGTKDLATAEVFDPQSGKPGELIQMATPRRDHIAVSLPNNNAILMVGGTSSGQTLRATELYIPWQNQFEAGDATAVARAGAAVTPLQEPGTLMVMGGRDDAAATRSVERTTYATLTANKRDYSPGEIVTLNGRGWIPGETVQITMAVNPKTHDNVTLKSLVDDQGRFTNSDYLVQVSDLNVRFFVTSVGLTSGRTAGLLTFTDAGGGSYTVALGTTTSQAAVATNFTATFTLPSTNGTKVGDGVITLPSNYTINSVSAVTITGVTGLNWGGASRDRSSRLAAILAAMRFRPAKRRR